MNKKRSNSKTMYVWWALGLGLVLLIGAGMYIANLNTEGDIISTAPLGNDAEDAANNNEGTNNETNEQNNTVGEGTSSETDTVMVSEAEYEVMVEGMRLSEVEEYLGGQGELIYESGEAGEYHKEAFIYPGENSLDSYAIFIYRNEELVSKHQYGLNDEPIASHVNVTTDEYNEITEGMNYSEVVAIIGGEGELITDTEQVIETIYVYDHEDYPHSTAYFVFEGGELEYKFATFNYTG